MRWKISPHFHFRPDSHLSFNPKDHDPRTIDALVMVALIVLVIGSGWYLAASVATPPSTTAFIVPSQNVHW